MNIKQYKSSWGAFALFYIVLLVIVFVLDWFNQLLTFRYFGAQVGLITLGIVIFTIGGMWVPDLSATRGILLTFTIGVLTIIPAVLMGLGRIPDFWPQYFNIAFGMAAGSFLSFLFLKFSHRFFDQGNQKQKVDDDND